ncbi:hypothetical protein F5Y14DRAFT_40430 [Nemania sp. NC0429]|nr:hypothetical protein F5Y14DRAFT_40430 [Nemania sp. NC0429]
MSADSDIKYLHRIAESRCKVPTIHDPTTLLRLLKQEALAFREPDSSKLRELTDRFRDCQEAFERGPYSKELKESIVGFYIILDECFFFKTLTRAVYFKTLSKIMKNIPTRITGLVELRFVEQQDPNDGLRGRWNPFDRIIDLYLGGADGATTFPVERVLVTVLHECVHAFLDLFVDRRHPDMRLIKEPNGHGPIFLDIFQSIGLKIKEITHSRSWEEKFYLSLEFLDGGRLGGGGVPGAADYRADDRHLPPRDSHYHPHDRRVPPRDRNFPPRD